jgi:hypothetical protein
MQPLRAAQVPDFLFAALDTTACAVPASRDRMKLANVNQILRKSGSKRAQRRQEHQG